MQYTTLSYHGIHFRLASRPKFWPRSLNIWPRPRSSGLGLAAETALSQSKILASADFKAKVLASPGLDSIILAMASAFALLNVLLTLSRYPFALFVQRLGQYFNLFCSNCDCFLVLLVYFLLSCNSTYFRTCSFIRTTKLRPVSPIRCRHSGSFCMESWKRTQLYLFCLFCSSDEPNGFSWSCIGPHGRGDAIL